MLNKLSKLFLKIIEKIGKAKPIYMFHGTHKSNLPSILSSGLLSNPKKRAWDNDEYAGINQPSRASLEGVYLTHNLMTAISSANNRSKKRDNQIVIMVSVQPQSLFLDEDEFNISLPGIPETSLLYMYFNSLYDYPEFLDDLKIYIDNVIERLSRELKNELNKNLEKRLKELLIDVFDKAIKRKVAYIGIHQYKSMWHRISYGNEEKYTELPPIPDKNKAEQDFKEAQDKFTRTIKILTRPDQINNKTEYTPGNNARITNDIGFSGSNKIIAIFEFIDLGNEINLIYPNNYSEIPEEALNIFKNQLKISGISSNI